MVHTLPAAGNLVDRPTDLLRLIGTTAANALETEYKRKSRSVVANDAASSKHALQPKTLFQIEWTCSWDSRAMANWGEVGCHVRLSVEVTPFKIQANLSGVV